MAHRKINKKYIIANTIVGGGNQEGQFYIKLPSNYCARIPGAKNLNHAHWLAADRYMERPKKWDHAYTIAFSLKSDHEDVEGDLVTKEELFKAIKKRLKRLKKSGDEITEACGASFDTFENDQLWVNPFDEEKEDEQ